MINMGRVRYCIKKLSEGWVAWDRVNKTPVTKPAHSKYYAQWELKKILPNLPQDYPDYKEINKQKSKERYWAKREEIRTKAIKFRQENPNYNKEALKKHKEKQLTKQRELIEEKKKLRDAEYQRRLKEEGSSYKHVEPIKKFCPTCKNEFLGRADKIYCKHKHHPSYIERKRISKRLTQGTSHRIPPWQDKASLMAYYDATPQGMVVDHIIPLNHPDVSGLHCIQNFQYLTIEDNSRKSNQFDGTNENNGWRDKKL